MIKRYTNLCLLYFRRAGVKFCGSWSLTHLSWAPAPHMQAPTCPATAPLVSYIHLPIMVVATLLLKCLIVFLTVWKQIASSVLRNYFRVPHWTIPGSWLLLISISLGDGGGGPWLVRMEWRAAGWSVCLLLLICPCTIKSRSSLLAQARLRGPRKSAVKRLWWWCGISLEYYNNSDFTCIIMTWHGHRIRISLVSA